MTIHIDQTFAPRLKIQEGISRFLHLESSPIATRQTLSSGSFRLGNRLEFHLLVVLITILQVEHLPLLQVGDKGASVNVDHQFNPIRDTFEILDSPSEIDTSHGLHQNIQCTTRRTSRQSQLFLSIPSVQFAHILAIDKDLCIVVCLVDMQHSRLIQARKFCAIQDTTKTLVIRFHGPDLLVLFRLWQIAEQRCYLRKLESGNRNRRNGRRHFRQPFALGIFGQGLPQFPIFGGCLTSLIDRSIVIIRSDIGSKSRRVGSCPMAPVGTSVGHVKTEGDPFGEHFVDTGNHVGSRTRLMVGSPFVKPATPKLTTHQRAVRTQLFQPGKLLVDVGSCTEVHRPDQIIQPIQGEVRRPVTLEERDLMAEMATDDVSHFRNIRFTLTIRAIFILDLHHDDRTPVLYSQSGHLTCYSLFKQIHPFQEVGILFTQSHIFLFQQPPG